MKNLRNNNNKNNNHNNNSFIKKMIFKCKMFKIMNNLIAMMINSINSFIQIKNKVMIFNLNK